MNLRITHARRKDPQTSHAAASRLKPQTQMHKLLLVYNEARNQGLMGLTDEQAGDAAWLSHTGYWKRCSDLRANGWIKRVYKEGRVVTEKGSSGQWQQVCAISAKGREELRKVEQL